MSEDIQDEFHAIAEEFATRPDHLGDQTLWKPGDPMMTDEQIRLSKEHSAREYQEEQARERERTAQARAEAETHRLEKFRKRVRRGIATLACIAAGTIVLAPGVGALDQVGAAMTHSADVVAAAPVKPDAEAAKARIVSLYQQIDEHGVDWAKQRAAEYRQNHADEFIGDETYRHVLEHIEAARSADEIIQILEPIVGQYGVKRVTADSRVGVGEVRDMARSVVRSLSPLPKSFVKDHALLRTIAMAPPSGRKTKDGAPVLGLMDSEGVMTLFGYPIEVTILQPFAALLAQPSSREHVFKHELGHAVQFKNGFGDSRYPTGLSAHDGDIAGDVWRNLVEAPAVPSLYAREEGGMEYGAELTAGLLGDGVISLPSPSRWRRFNSPLTMQELSVLADLEKMQPGIAGLLIADSL